MPAAKAYLIQRVEDGTFRTVQAHSNRSAVERFIAEYKPFKDERLRVKERESSEDWVEYKVSAGRTPPKEGYSSPPPKRSRRPSSGVADQAKALLEKTKSAIVERMVSRGVPHNEAVRIVYGKNT